MIPEFLPSLIILACALFPPSTFWLRVLVIIFACLVEVAIFKVNFNSDRQAYLDSFPSSARERHYD